MTKINLLNQGLDAYCVTKRGKLLFIDDSHFDDYSSTAHVHILIGVDGKFWGYSDANGLKKI